MAHRTRTKTDYVAIVAWHEDGDDGLLLCATVAGETGHPGARIAASYAFPHQTWDAAVPSFPHVLMNLAAERSMRAGEGTVVVDRWPVSIFDDGDDTRQRREFAEEVARHGWKAAVGADLDTGWMTFTHTIKDYPVIHVGCRRQILANDPDGIIRKDDKPEQLAERLATYAALVGAPYRATPGVAGLGAIRNIYDRLKPVRRERGGTGWVPRQQPRWTWNPEQPMRGCGDLHWRRHPTKYERENYPFVHVFDIRAAYLAAAAGARLGWDTPTHAGSVVWDPSQSGFYRILVRGHTWADPRFGVPIINPDRIESDGTCWVTGPILAYISSTGELLPEIIDSWICVRAGRILNEWADHLRDAIPDAATAGDPILRAAIKATYTRAWGLLGRPGGRIHRDDWHATIADEARTRMLRKIWGWHAIVGEWPLKVNVDAVWIAAPDDKPDAIGIGAGPSIGQFKHVETVSMADYLAANRPAQPLGSKR
jgi:hypothetical protein